MAREKGSEFVAKGNVLTVLNVMLKTALAWNIIERMPCVISLVPVQRSSASFHEFEEYERLVAVAKEIGAQTYAIILLGGDAGLRAGEIVALEWSDVDFGRRQLTIRRSDWQGESTSPKGGRLRYVPMTIRLASALRELRHLRSRRVVCRDDGSSLRRQNLQKRVWRAARRAKVKDISIHALRHTFCSHLAMRGVPANAIQALAGHQQLSTTERYMHLSPVTLKAAIGLLDSSRDTLKHGDILETPTEVTAKLSG